MNNFSNTQKMPLVSVIMPIRNEEIFIKKSLGAILQQTYPRSLMEILITDGCSTDKTREIIEQFQKEYENIIYLNNPKKIVPTGLNLAIKQSKGEVIIRIDGHTIIDKDYIKNCVDLLLTSNADNVGGRMQATNTTSLFGKAVAIATSTPFGIGNSRFHYSKNEEFVDSVYMGAWHRNLFSQIGLFDEELVRNQDDEFNYRLRKNGGKILLSPKIKSIYTVRSTPKALWKQYFQYGFWKVRVLQKHPKQMSLRHFIPPVFVAALAISGLFFIFFPKSQWIYSITPALYLVFDLIVSLRLGLKNNFTVFLIMLIVFPILHLSYGCGFLWGLVKFLNKWRLNEGKQ